MVAASKHSMNIATFEILRNQKETLNFMI